MFKKFSVIVATVILTLSFSTAFGGAGASGILPTCTHGEALQNAQSLGVYYVYSIFHNIRPRFKFLQLKGAFWDLGPSGTVTPHGGDMKTLGDFISNFEPYLKALDPQSDFYPSPTTEGRMDLHMTLHARGWDKLSLDTPIENVFCTKDL